MDVLSCWPWPQGTDAEPHGQTGPGGWALWVYNCPGSQHSWHNDKLTQAPGHLVVVLHHILQGRGLTWAPGPPCSGLPPCSPEGHFTGPGPTGPTGHWPSEAMSQGGSVL